MERMQDFFSARLDSYEEQMLEHVEGCREAYRELVQYLPEDCKRLLDLGCGTGLELEEIWKVRPELRVTGIDLTQSMLDRLRQNYPNCPIRLICGDYFTVPFENEAYDAAVSVQTMHHFPHKAKVGLYRKIAAALQPGGVYIECDYMVEKQEEEDFFAAENARIRRELGIPLGEFYHIDTPCTIQNQIQLLYAAGFTHVEQVFRKGNTTIVVAQRNAK